MLSLDDRTGNVLTTIGLFAAVLGLAFAARATLVVCVLAMLIKEFFPCSVPVTAKGFRLPVPTN